MDKTKSPDKGWTRHENRPGSGSGHRDDRKNVEEKRFVQIPPENIVMAAESIGISSLNPNISRSLAEDATYRCREIASVCSQLLRHSKRRRLNGEDVNRALKWADVEPVYGYSGGPEVTPAQMFQHLPEVDLFVERSNDLELADIISQPVHDIEENISVTGEWLSVEGVPPSEDGGPISLPQSSFTPALIQYYTALTTHLLGDSEQLCSVMLRDIRTNPKISPLLPFLVTFNRNSMQRHSLKPEIIVRLLRLMSSVFSNQYLNLAPKPYLSHLVTALLSSLIFERKDRVPDKLPSLEHVPLAASILRQALDRWATPINQLRSQTLRALREYISPARQGTVSYHSQYGALSAMVALGAPVLEECLLPHLQHYLVSLSSQMEISTKGPNLQVLNLVWGTVREAGLSILNHLKDEDVPVTKNSGDSEDQSDLAIDPKCVYQILYDHYGDSLVMDLKKLCHHTPISKSKEQPGKMRLRRIVGGKTRFRSGSHHSKQGGNMISAPGSTVGKIQSGIFTSNQNTFDYLADMGVPSDIFEPSDILDKPEQKYRDSDMDYSSGLAQGRSGSLHFSAKISQVFPDCRLSRPRVPWIRVDLGPCRQWNPERLRQGKPTRNPPSHKESVPWRQHAVGGRIGTAYRRKHKPYITKVPSYLNMTF